MGIRNLASIMVLAWIFSTPAMGQSSATPIMPFDPATASFDEGHGDAMIGWTFHVKTTLQITQVGWYDQGLDGLSRAFRVGLWQDLSGNYFAPGSAPTALFGASGISIPAGTAAAINGNYRVVTLSPRTLVPGDYELAGLDTAATTDVIKYKAFPFGYSDPQINLRQFFFGYDGLTTFHAVNSNYFYLLPGLEIGPMVFVPEPACWVALTTACILMAERRRFAPR